MVKVVINALAAAAGGSTTNYDGLLPALAEIDHDNDYVLLRAPWQDYLPPVPGPNFRWEVCPITRRSLGRRVWFEQTGLVGILRRERADVLYSPAEVTSLAAPCAVVLVLQNLSAYTQRWSMGPEYWKRYFLLGELARISAWKAERVIFVSRTSRRVIARRLRLPLRKTAVIYHGIDPAFRPGARVTGAPPAPFLTRPYILSVSQIRRSKNFARLVEAFASLRGRGGEELDLVILGGVAEESARRDVLRIVEREGLRGRVHLPGLVPHLELPAWYASARVVVHPSLLESFGYPVLEAMACGVPVTASCAPSIPEIAGGAALLFDPTSVASIADAVACLLEDRAFADVLVRRGLARAREFTWVKAATAMRGVLEEAARSRR